MSRYAQAVRLAPGEGSYHFKLACTAWRADQIDLVEPHLLHAVRLDPGNPAVQEGAALWFARQGDYSRALQYVDTALALSPESIQFKVTRADVLTANRQHQAAWQLISPLIAAGICGTRLARIYAKLAPAIGHERQAIAYIDQALGVPGLVDPNDAPRLQFAAVSLLDSIGSHDEAFGMARRANHASRRPFDRVAYSVSIAMRIDYYTKSRLASLPRATHHNRRPVLIVGMPRSGTSLVEQILATHPAVFGGGELMRLVDIALSAVKRPWTRGNPFPHCSDYMSLQDANEMAAEYLGTISTINSSATYVTDKMPMNYLLLGMVASLMPDIRIIHCVRDPRDTCLSCYFTDFGTRHDFTFDVGDLASVYRDYQRLMAHWKQVLPLPILDVRYEELVTDQRGQTKRLLEYLELPWDERCMGFHENKRVVATASRDQVTRPIYSSSIGRWKNYEKHIGPWMGL